MTKALFILFAFKHQLRSFTTFVKMSSISFVIVLMTSTAMIDLTMGKIIDLTHAHSNKTYMIKPPKYTRTILYKGDYRPGVYAEANSYEIAEHGGTHMDAPNHFLEGARSLSEIPIEDTILEGVMVDCSKEAAKDLEYMVTVEKLTNWEKVHGMIPDRAAVIFNFNRSSRFFNPEYYLETDNVRDVYTFRTPSVSEEAGEWMASERNVKAIATDTPSSDSFKSNRFPVHVRFLQDNRLLVEMLNIPDELPPRNFRFHFSPVKFVGGTGVQIRAYAMTYDSPNHGAKIDGWSVSVCGLVALVSVLSFVFTV